MIVSELIHENHWMILRGQEELGPFTYETMIQMRQQLQLDETDFVWSPQLDKWTRVFEIPDFSADRLARLFERTPDSSLFKPRSHSRAKVSTECLVHDESQVWTGELKSLSLGGALIQVRYPWLAVGETITLHIRKVSDELPAFNCLAEVRSRKPNQKRIQFDSNTDYSVCFKKLAVSAQQGIAKITKKENS